MHRDTPFIQAGRDNKPRRWHRHLDTAKVAPSDGMALAPSRAPGEGNRASTSLATITQRAIAAALNSAVNNSFERG